MAGPPVADLVPVEARPRDGDGQPDIARAIVVLARAARSRQRRATWRRQWSHRAGDPLGVRVVERRRKREMVRLGPSARFQRAGPTDTASRRASRRRSLMIEAITAARAPATAALTSGASAGDRVRTPGVHASAPMDSRVTRRAQRVQSPRSWGRIRRQCTSASGASKTAANERDQARSAVPAQARSATARRPWRRAASRPRRPTARRGHRRGDRARTRGRRRTTRYDGRQRASRPRRHEIAVRAVREQNGTWRGRRVAPPRGPGSPSRGRYGRRDAPSRRVRRHRGESSTSLTFAGAPHGRLEEHPTRVTACRERRPMPPVRTSRPGAR